jgi:ABC-2 type transport system ATP-binding protein
MLQVIGVEKSYGSHKVVHGISLQVRPGEVVGLLGPNGAGKTTTVSIIAGLLQADAGEVLMNGKSLHGASNPLKSRIGLVPQDLGLFEVLSAQENCALFGALQGLRGKKLDLAIRTALAFVGLQDRAGHQVATYSGGMKRRLNIAAALIHDPDVLIFDEPTVGVDPQSRNAIFTNIETLKTQGKALLFTTHYMEEAQRLCDRIIIMDSGRILAEDDLQGLLRRLPVSNRLCVDLDPECGETWLEELKLQPFASAVDLHGNRLRIGLKDLPGDAPLALGWLAEHGLRWTRIDNEQADLEAVFLSLTGHSLRDA